MSAVSTTSTASGEPLRRLQPRRESHRPGKVARAADVHGEGRSHAVEKEVAADHVHPWVCRGGCWDDLHPVAFGDWSASRSPTTGGSDGWLDHRGRHRFKEDLNDWVRDGRPQGSVPTLPLETRTRACRWSSTRRPKRLGQHPRRRGPRQGRHRLVRFRRGRGLGAALDLVRARAWSSETGSRWSIRRRFAPSSTLFELIAWPTEKPFLGFPSSGLLVWKPGDKTGTRLRCATVFPASASAGSISTGWCTRRALRADRRRARGAALPAVDCRASCAPPSSPSPPRRCSGRRAVFSSRSRQCCAGGRLRALRHRRGLLPARPAPLFPARPLGDGLGLRRPLHRHLRVAATKLTTAANAIFLQYAAPAYVLVLSPWLLREPFRKLDAWCVALRSPGCRCSSSARSRRDRRRGNLLGVASGVFFALGVVLIRRIARGGQGDALPSMTLRETSSPWRRPCRSPGARCLRW